MTTFAELQAAMPDVFQAISLEDTRRSRLAPWVEAAGLVRTRDLGDALDSFPTTDDVFFPRSLDPAALGAILAVVGANEAPLRLLRELRAPRFAAVGVPLEDVDPFSESDHSVLAAGLPPLLWLQYLEARHMACTGRREGALAQVGLMLRTASHLLGSSFSGAVNNEGLDHLHTTYAAIIGLSEGACAGDERLLADVLAALDGPRLRAIDYARTQLLQLVAALPFAVLNCPDDGGSRAIIDYLHDSHHLRRTLFPAFVGQAEGTAYRLRVLANRLLEGHPFPFDKAATVAELRESLSTPWAQLDDEPARLRTLWAEVIGREFVLPGVPEAFATVIVGGRYLTSRALCDAERQQPLASESLLATPNPMGKAIVFEATRIAHQRLAVVMDCWYYARLMGEVARLLVGIKAFSLRWRRAPLRASEVVEDLHMQGAPQDPYSRTDLQYLPDQGVVRIDPTANDIAQWAAGEASDFDAEWRVLG
ncbi:MAG: hypothetical protein ABSG86_29900 [Thermoguttaceae bacterium]|jgi:hypothetical protein